MEAVAATQTRVPPLVERVWAARRKAREAGMIRPEEQPQLVIVDGWDSRADLN